MAESISSAAFLQRLRNGLEWFDRAQKTLEAALKKDNENASGRRFFRDLHAGRAETLVKLKQYDNAIAEICWCRQKPKAFSSSDRS